ncbi:ABC transporter ATP-binding protein [Marinobacter halophilus]|uniref:Nitrate/sulfonate/bicarbonate ABC transporter ATP-binding protein n=1 Tax=Marinobacter halophilus TaxID=1323740 RepID=A0A2T1KE55_9GAMM|nr:ATP-binding cassette domain-containing protein [Marinobacter halophilus]PSF08424.1 nitrate/sulfonate/bicarbonate ABC transporter ATP-binding protein [Marinobacter halophilus]GGC60443.1 nitrate/sulfonate/bicarbonate ABC transporter ATP-binding protein [Marinobacter halophilus]
MLALERVSLDLGPNQILSDINLTVSAGESVCLVGPSGCGKTSLLRLASGAVEATSGQVVNSFATTAAVFQEPRLLPWQRMLDNIALGLKARGVGRGERLARARELADRVGLADRYEHFPHELSGGMQQRVALARALAVGADFLLLDEPFSALDVGLRSEAQDLVEQLVVDQGIATLMVTHDLTEALRLAHRVVVISGSPGHVVFEHWVDTPFTERSPAWLYEEAGHLLRQPVVSESFLFHPEPEVA